MRAATRPVQAAFSSLEPARPRRLLLLAVLVWASSTGCGRINYDRVVVDQDAAVLPDLVVTEVPPLDVPGPRPDVSPDRPPDVSPDRSPDLVPDVVPDVAPAEVPGPEVAIDVRPPDVSPPDTQPPACPEPFAAATEVALPGVTGDMYSPRIAPDGRTLFFSVQATGNRDSVDLFTATRAAAGAPFSNVRPLAEANTASEDGAAFLAADSLELHFFSTRPGGAGGRDLYLLRRATADGAWASSRFLAELNTASSEYMPSLTGDALVIYFATDRGPGIADDIYSASRASPTQIFSPPVPVPGMTAQTSPFIAADGRTLYFAGANAGGQGGRDIWVAQRPRPQDPFGPPMNLGPMINSAATDDDPSVSLDGRELFFVSDRARQSRIFRATRCQ